MVNKGWGRIFGVTLVLAILAMVPVVIGWGELPDPFASHWGFGGAPNAHMPLWVLPLLPLGLIGLGLVIASLFHTDAGPSAEGLALLGGLGAMAVAVTTSTVILNHGAATWDQAAHMSWVHLVAVLASMVVVGILGYRVGKSWFPHQEPISVRTNAPLIPVGDGEIVVWIGRCNVRYPYVFAGIAAIFLVFLPDPFRWLALPFLAVALFLSYVRVTVDANGLRARLGGFFTRRIALSEMASVDVIDLDPSQWGGWGYRAAPGRTAIVLRRGPAIEVQLTSGRKFAVTVDDAATGAGLLNGLLVRNPHT